MEILESPLAVILMRNDQKANGECRYMIAKPIGGVALSLQAMPAQDHMVKIVVMYLSGTVLLELEYAADMPVKEIFDDVKGQLEANGGYTRWDLEAVSIVHAGQPTLEGSRVDCKAAAWGHRQRHQQGHGRREGEEGDQEAFPQTPFGQRILRAGWCGSPM